MDFTTENIEDIRILTVNLNRATFMEAESFQRLLDDEISLGNRRVVIDLQSCVYIDPVFLGIIIVSLRKLVSLDGNIKLVKPSIDEANMNIINSLRIFEIFNTKSEALKSYRQIFVAPDEFYLYGNSSSLGPSFSF